MAVVQCLSTRGQYSCETEALCLLLFSVCPLEASTAVRRGLVFAVVQCLSTRGQYSCETEALCLLLFMLKNQE